MKCKITQGDGLSRVTFVEVGREVGSVTCTSFDLEGRKLVLYEDGTEFMTVHADKVEMTDGIPGTVHYAGVISDEVESAASVLMAYGCMCKAEYTRLSEAINSMSECFADDDVSSGMSEVAAAVSMVTKCLHRFDEVVPDDVYQSLL